MRSSNLAIGFSVIGLCVAAASARATVLPLLSVEDQVAHADLVIEGRVGRAVTHRDPRSGRPWTDTVIEVERVLVGRADGRVVVRQLGGELDGVQTRIVGDGVLEPGLRVVLFLRRAHERYALLSFGQSVFHVLGEGDGARLARSFDGLMLMAQGRAVMPGRGPATLAALRRRVAAAGLNR